MKTGDAFNIVIIAGVGYILWTARDQIKGIFQGPAEISNAAGNLAGSVGFTTGSTLKTVAGQATGITGSAANVLTGGLDIVSTVEKQIKNAVDSADNVISDVIASVTRSSSSSSSSKELNNVHPMNWTGGSSQTTISIKDNSGERTIPSVVIPSSPIPKPSIDLSNASTKVKTDTLLKDIAKNSTTLGSLFK